MGSVIYGYVYVTKHTKKYKTIERFPPMRIPMKISAVHTITVRTSISYSELEKTNSLPIYCANTTFQVKIFNFKTSHNLLYHFILYTETDTSL